MCGQLPSLLKSGNDLLHSSTFQNILGGNLRYVGPEWSLFSGREMTLKSRKKMASSTGVRAPQNAGANHQMLVEDYQRVRLPLDGQGSPGSWTNVAPCTRQESSIQCAGAPAVCEMEHQCILCPRQRHLLCFMEDSRAIQSPCPLQNAT